MEKEFRFFASHRPGKIRAGPFLKLTAEGKVAHKEKLPILLDKRARHLSLIIGKDPKGKDPVHKPFGQLLAISPFKPHEYQESSPTACVNFPLYQKLGL